MRKKTTKKEDLKFLTREQKEVIQSVIFDEFYNSFSILIPQGAPVSNNLKENIHRISENLIYKIEQCITARLNSKID